MTCDDCREQLSARLDGEDDAGARTVVDEHLAGCTACRGWLDGAAMVNRLARTEVARPTPDLTASVLAAAPRTASRQAQTVLRGVLGLLGAGQLALAGFSLFSPDKSGHHGTVEGASMSHFVNEFAAWNLALGVGFLWIALRTPRPLGVLPILSAFVVALTATEVLDLVQGHVEPSRMFAHALVQAGFVVILGLRSRRFGGDGLFPRGDALPEESAWSTRSDESRSNPAGDRDAAPDPYLRPTAQRRAA